MLLADVERQIQHGGASQSVRDEFFCSFRGRAVSERIYLSVFKQLYGRGVLIEINGKINADKGSCNILFVAHLAVVSWGNLQAPEGRRLAQTILKTFQKLQVVNIAENVCQKLAANWAVSRAVDVKRHTFFTKRPLVRPQGRGGGYRAKMPKCKRRPIYEVNFIEQENAFL